MQELAQESKQQVSQHKKKSSPDTHQNPSLSVTLPVLSTLNEKGFNPFWDQRCEEIQSTLWLPQKTDSLGQGLTLSSGSLNYQVDASRFWIKRLTPTMDLIPPPLSVLLPHSATATTGVEAIKGAKVLASKKIRFYPHDQQAYEQALALYRRAYNLAVEMINAGHDLVDGKFVDIRPIIRQKTEAEQRERGAIYNNELPNEAVREAKDKLKDVIAKNKKLSKAGAKSGYAELGFKSRKGAIHTFNFPKFPKGKNIAIKALGKVFLTEEVPAECFKKACKVTRNKGRWYLQVQQLIDIKPEIQGKVKCVGVDQGVRTFLTTFSDKQALIIGDDFAKTHLTPLMLRVDKLISAKQKILNQIKSIEAVPQWASDRLCGIDKAINRLKCRKDDLVLDLHNRAAFELVNEYDVIFLPTFETRNMVRRKGNKVRTIRRNTCRQMLDLQHYQFKVRIKWYAKKYGKVVVDTNEAYTSKTRSWNGEIVNNLGGAKVIKGEGFSVDRDINGSRNTLIKNLSKAA